MFDDEHHYRDVAVKLTSGAFRFVTGNSEKAAYKITTPLATIGVRGTILDILSQRGKTIIKLQEGAATVCTISVQCIQLTQPGDTAVITSSNGKITIKKTNNVALDLRSDLRRTPRGFAAPRQYADATPTVIPPVDDGSDPTGMLCGR